MVECRLNKVLCLAGEIIFFPLVARKINIALDCCNKQVREQEIKTLEEKDEYEDEFCTSPLIS